jgi:hypothetical protein
MLGPCLVGEDLVALFRTTGFGGDEEAGAVDELAMPDFDIPSVLFVFVLGAITDDTDEPDAHVIVAGRMTGLDQAVMDVITTVLDDPVVVGEFTDAHCFTRALKGETEHFVWLKEPFGSHPDTSNLTVRRASSQPVPMPLLDLRSREIIA